MKEERLRTSDIAEALNASPSTISKIASREGIRGEREGLGRGKQTRYTIEQAEAISRAYRGEEGVKQLYDWISKKNTVEEKKEGGKKELKPSQERRKKMEKNEEQQFSHPISDELKKKWGFQEMEMLPQERPPYEILEEILRSYNANEKIIKLLIRKCARRDLAPDEVQYNLSQLGVRKNEAEWIADEYNDAIIEEERRIFEGKKPRPRGREVIREDEGRPYRGRYQEGYSEASPMRGYNRGESRMSYPYSNDSAPLTKEDISKMIEDALMKRDKEEKISNLSNSIKNLEISLKEEIQKIRNEIPTESDIKEKTREVSGKEENKEGEYEKVLKQKIDDLKDEREKVKEETKEKTNELKEDFKEKEKDLKDKIESLEKDMKSSQQQSNSYNEDTWRYKSDITGKIMGGATTMTRDILDRAPIRKGLNIWVRGAEEEGEEREKMKYIEPKQKPPELPEEYTLEE